MHRSLRKLALVALLAQPTSAFALVIIPIPLLDGWGLGGIAMVLGIVGYLASRRDK